MVVDVGSKYLQVRITPEARAALKATARREGRTASGLTRWLIERHLEESKRERAVA